MEKCMIRLSNGKVISREEWLSQALSLKETSILLKKEGFEVDDTFCKMDSYYKTILRKDMAEILTIANFWKPYVGSEKYNKFVLALVKKFFKVHAIAINNNPSSEKIFIGDYVELEGIPLMDELVTTVTHSGGNAALLNTSTKWKLTKYMLSY